MPDPNTKATDISDNPLPIENKDNDDLLLGNQDEIQDNSFLDEEKRVDELVDQYMYSSIDGTKPGNFANLLETIACVTLVFSLITMPVMAGIIASMSFGLPIVATFFISIGAAISSLLSGLTAYGLSKNALLYSSYHIWLPVKSFYGRKLTILENQLKNLSSNSTGTKKEDTTQDDKQKEEVPKSTFFENRMCALNPRNAVGIIQLSFLIAIATSVIVGTLAFVGIGGVVTSSVLPASIIGVCLFHIVSLIIIGKRLEKKYLEPEKAAQKTFVDLEEKIKETQAKIEEIKENTEGTEPEQQPVIIKETPTVVKMTTEPEPGNSNNNPTQDPPIDVPITNTGLGDANADHNDTEKKGCTLQ